MSTGPNTSKMHSSHIGAAYKPHKAGKPDGNMVARGRRYESLAKLRGTESSPQYHAAAQCTAAIEAGATLSGMVQDAGGVAISRQGLGDTYYVIGYLPDAVQALGLVLAAKRIGVALRAMDSSTDKSGDQYRPAYSGT